VTITKPSSGTTVSGEIIIEGQASDPEGNVERVDVMIDSGSWKTASGTTSWNFVWNSTSVGDGLHEIRARSFDGIQYSPKLGSTQPQEPKYQETFPYKAQPRILTVACKKYLSKLGWGDGSKPREPHPGAINGTQLLFLTEIM
jgi:hypothetical protein